MTEEGVTPEASESLIERIELGIALVLQAGIFIVTIIALLERQWLGAFSGAVVLLLTFAPAMLRHKLRVALPVEFTLVLCLFLYASYALGEAQDFYERFWWWDLMLHGISALVMGIIGDTKRNDPAVVSDTVNSAARVGGGHQTLWCKYYHK